MKAINSFNKYNLNFSDYILLGLSAKQASTRWCQKLSTITEYSPSFKAKGPMMYINLKCLDEEKTKVIKKKIFPILMFRWQKGRENTNHKEGYG